MARIAAVGEAFPEYYYRQAEILEALERIWGDRDLDMVKLERLHRHAAVRGRHLALPLEAYQQQPRWGDANDTWIRIADELGGRAVLAALTAAGLGIADVGTLIFTSVTGLATPSIDARLVNRLGLSPGVKRLPLFGLGCVAGAAGIARCADLAKGDADAVIVLLSVELCSLTFQYDDLSVPNQVAAGLFGDGAAAAVIVGRNRPADGPCVVATRSVFYPDTVEAMGWRISEKGFQLLLSREIPTLIRRHLGEDVDRFLAESSLGRRDITTWMAHSGGPRILSAVKETLDLSDEALAVTWESLRSVGNISSASILHVLKRTMEQRRPPRGSLGLLFAMGPGFCAELVLVRW
ncbi:MAG: type III polyketide synthase [Acidobacteriota bacterium]